MQDLTPSSQIVRTGSLAQTQTYSYDANDRLTSVCFQAGACPGASDPFIRFTYDKVGNRLSEQRPGVATTSYSYDARDRLLSAGSTSYTYDANGNQLSAGSRTFAYDLANRLKTTTLGSTTTTYLYDGDGVRQQASTGSQASRKTNYLWDTSFGLPQVALERDGNSNPIRRYLYGVRRISQTAGNNTSYFVSDGLGSTANLTSSSGSTQWTWSYEPFGSLRTETKASGNQPDNLMRFTGAYLDPTGLYHLRVRQYDPASGRFLRSDPAGQSPNESAISVYAYVANRPTVMVDPSGEIFRPSGAGLEAASIPTSLEEFEAPSPRLTPQMRTNARIIFTLARQAGLSQQRARELVAAAFKESTLNPTATNAGTGAAGLFQLLGPFANRASKLGSLFNPRVNTCAILPNFSAYWRTQPKAAPGQCASDVEASGKSASFYAGPLAWLPASFKRIAVRPCPSLKPICAPYFGGTRFAFPNCSMNG